MLAIILFFLSLYVLYCTTTICTDYTRVDDYQGRREKHAMSCYDIEAVVKARSTSPLYSSRCYTGRWPLALRDLGLRTCFIGSWERLGQAGPCSSEIARPDRRESKRCSGGKG